MAGQPLTERILDRLAGPRVVWIVAWASLPWFNAGINLLLGGDRTSAVWEQSALLVTLNYAALSIGVVVTLWGTGRIARQLETLASPTASVRSRTREPFRAIGSTAGPLLVSAAAAIVFGAGAFVRDGWSAALLRGVTWFIIGIALWTFVWTYGSLLLGLSRLGRERVVADAIHVDPGLGVQPLGRVASTGLWMLLVWLVPVLLTGLPDVAGAAIGIAVLAAALAAFFLSLSGLHRQMVDVKASELAIARDLYAEAYEPVHEARSLEALERQRNLLSAADALEKRANAIHEWPIDEGTLARVVTITTSVIAMTLGRLILDPFGL